MVIHSLNQVILPAFRWARMWGMIIKYICDLYKVISKSDIQLCSYCDENEAPTIHTILPLLFYIFPGVQSKEGTEYLTHSGEVTILKGTQL